MSWFTVPKGTTESCPRCKKPGSSRLVKRGDSYDIYDCVRCGPVPQKEKR